MKRVSFFLMKRGFLAGLCGLAILSARAQGWPSPPQKADVNEIALAAMRNAPAGAAQPAAAVPGELKPFATPEVEKRVAPASPTLPVATFQRSVFLPALSQDVLNALKNDDNQPAKGRLRIGLGRTLEQAIVVNPTSVSSGEWTALPDGSRIFAIEVTVQGALGLRLHVEELALPSGVTLVVYDPKDPTAAARAITSAKLADDRDVWTETIPAERVVLECQVPPGTDPQSVSFVLSEVSHLYRSIGPGDLPMEGACHNDVTCYPTWAQQAAGVARMVFVDGASSYLCTGCLLADRDPSTFIDYFLTANHCIDRQTVASTLELYWFYQTGTCNGPAPSLGTVPHTGGGADFLRGSSANDFTFLRLRQASPANVFYLGWTATPPAGNESVACIEHPDGSYKRIAFGNRVSSDPDFVQVRWSSGVTEPGSSGSPLLNASHQVVGQLYGGDSACDRPLGIDDFGRFDLTYNAIRQWIDVVCSAPANDACSGAIALSSGGAYYSESTTCATDDPSPCFSPAAIYRGVWFTWTALASGTAIADTCGSDFDTKLEVFSGPCGGLVSLGCDDDGTNCAPQATLSFPCTAGVTYRLCAGGYAGASGNLRLRVVPPACAALVAPTPANPVCGGLADSATPTLSWNGGANASGFGVRIFAGANCSGSPIHVSAALPSNATSYAVPLAAGLRHGQTYSWQVQALGDGVGFCDSPWSGCCSFGVKTCSYTLDSAGTNFGAGAAAGGFQVITTDGCDWTAVACNTCGWIHVSSSGVGSGPVVFTVDANPATHSRSGTISVAGQNYAVVQGPAFVPIKGSYYGLFQARAQAANESSGFFRLATTTQGRFSGQVQIGTRRYAFTGRLDAGGRASLSVARLRMPALELTLQMDLDDPDRVTGTLSDGNWTAELAGNRNVFDRVQNPAPQAGKYTLIVAGDETGHNEPSGDGYGTVSVDGAGNVRLSGTLADGTKFSQSAALSKLGLWPLYAPLYLGRGSVLSWIRYSDSPDADLSGDLSWFKPALPAARYYPGGFAMKTVAYGSRYQRPAAGTRVLDLTTARVVVAGGGLAQSLTNQVSLGADNKVANLSSNNLSFSFTLTSGLFRGKVTDPSSSKSISLTGAVVQKRNTAAGFFLGANTSGSVELKNDGQQPRVEAQ